MDYRKVALAEINSVVEEFTNYSIGKILYGIVKSKPDNVSVKEWLYNIPDEEIYTILENFKLKERD